MAMIHFFPIGSYTILGYYELQGITFNNELKVFQLPDGKKIFGLALVRVLCPQKLEIPFLPYRTISGKNCLACCKTCADLEQLNCKHLKR